MKQRPHDYQACASNLCAGDDRPEREFCGWFADEAVCHKTPYTPWQKKQVKIQKLYKLGKLKFSDEIFYLSTLQKIRRVTKTVRGINPQRRVN